VVVVPGMTALENEHGRSFSGGWKWWWWWCWPRATAHENEHTLLVFEGESICYKVKTNIKNKKKVGTPCARYPASPLPATLMGLSTFAFALMLAFAMVVMVVMEGTALENELRELVFESGGGGGRTTLKNEQRVLVFEGSVVVVVGGVVQEQPHSKTSSRSSFSRVVNEHTLLVFVVGGVGQDQSLSKTYARSRVNPVLKKLE